MKQKIIKIMEANGHTMDDFVKYIDEYHRLKLENLTDDALEWIATELKTTRPDIVMKEFKKKRFKTPLW